MKKINLSILVILLVPLFSLTLKAQENCPEQVQSFGNTQIQQLYSTKGKRCFFRVMPKTTDIYMVYRNYLLTDDGMMMVFNSYSDQFDDKSDGAREFFFYTNSFEGFQWFVEGESLIVKAFDQRTFKFLLKTAQIQEISGGKVSVADKVSPDNAGGVEILNFENVYVDAGFRMAASPSADQKSSSVVKNPQGQICKIPNGKVYEYKTGSSYLKSKPDLKAVVNFLCPQFNWVD